MEAFFIEVYGAGLTGLWDNILSNWITPLYLAAVAVFALVFLKDRAWMKLIGFVGIAAVVGVLVFAGSDLFGGKDKGLTKVAKGVAEDVNTVTNPLLSNSGVVNFAELPSGFNN